jgi:hypothetical protein
MTLTDKLNRFATVTLVPVIYRGEVRFELRLYVPNRIGLTDFVILMTIADEVYVSVGTGESPVVLEYNRAGICFNGFVEVTADLRNAVDRSREHRGLKPTVLPSDPPK